MATTPRSTTQRVLGAVLTAALLVTAAAACGAVQSAGPQQQTPQARQALLDRWRSRADVPAVVAGLDDAHGTTWVGASGSPERGSATPVSTSASFRTASITKVFVAVVTLQLVEEGRLRLDDPVARYLPDVSAGRVTVRELLNHTSGLPDYSQAAGLGKELLEDRNRRWSTTEVLALVAHDKPQFPPGTGYQYSNTDYVVLGEVIRVVTGTSWARQVRQRLLDPLQLTHTFIAGLEPARAAVLPGYFDADNDGDEENVETGGPWLALETSEGPAGALISTAADLLAFGDALFRGHLLRPATLMAMVAEGPFHPRNSNYGLGLEILRPDYRTVIWGHGGFLPGFRSVLWYVPSRDAVIVVLTNDSLANPPDLAELIMRTLTPGNA
ncbi:D-alanyl-D-alanine carboxypeptidase [Friedmanniella luteola]|uniref:D-alanyl-D-alanine carboxypeptidase n=1 Tax=Friedmanniella luteola TaxID=546871 RepID=A0A1H1VCS6_9ACTN|nr:serine hydrolase domain-containing protein [Friedmanniella luteola]SDS82483.1 D-alanyl-D-alanine carboxypeptidase [Friedmanniella luteola]